MRKLERPIWPGFVVGVVLATGVMITPVAAADASLRIEPATVAAANGQTFTIQVIQETLSPSSGVQASIDFDPAILQIASIVAGPAYATAPIVLPSDLPAALAKANKTGHLAQIAAAYVKPAYVPAGPAAFMVVTFTVVGCGTTEIALPIGPFDAQMIAGDEATYGEEVKLTTRGASVTTCVSAGAVEVEPSIIATKAVVPGDVPWFLIGIASLAAGLLLGAYAWRARRRSSPRDLGSAG